MPLLGRADDAGPAKQFGVEQPLVSDLFETHHIVCGDIKYDIIRLGFSESCRQEIHCGERADLLNFELSPDNCQAKTDGSNR